MVVKPTLESVQTTGAQVKDVVHQVVVDGRFINEFTTNPQAAANHLGITVGKETQAKLTSYTSTKEMTGTLNHQVSAVPQVMNVVAIVVIAIIVLWPTPAYRTSNASPVVDPKIDEKD